MFNWFSAPATGGLFGAKPAGFGATAQPLGGTGFNTGLGTGTSLFNNQQKPLGTLGTTGFGTNTGGRVHIQRVIQ